MRVAPNSDNVWRSSKIILLPVGTVSFCVQTPPLSSLGRYGHSWVLLEKALLPKESWGFYPGMHSKGKIGDLLSIHLFGGARGVVKTNDHLKWWWQRRLCYQITQEGVDALTNAIRAIERRRPRYDIQSYNCTHFIQEVASRISLDVPILGCYAVSPWCYHNTLGMIYAATGFWKGGWVEEVPKAATLSEDAEVANLRGGLRKMRV
jgi:hypothetical protein